jgi:hypothetical protein
MSSVISLFVFYASLTPLDKSQKAAEEAYAKYCKSTKVGSFRIPGIAQPDKELAWRKGR